MEEELRRELCGLLPQLERAAFPGCRLRWAFACLTLQGRPHVLGAQQATEPAGAPTPPPPHPPTLDHPTPNTLPHPTPVPGTQPRLQAWSCMWR